MTSEKMLKPCMHRGAEIIPGMFACGSNRIDHPIPNLAPVEVCEICIYHERPNRVIKPPPPFWRRPGDVAFWAIRLSVVGWMVEKMLKRLGFKCRCHQRREWMNNAGWSGILKHAWSRLWRIK